MNKLVGALVVAATLVVSWPETAEASYCGAARWACCKKACCCQSYTVMKRCKVVTYEPVKEITKYKTVYVEVTDKVEVDTIEFVPDTEERMIKTVEYETRQVNCPQPSCCGCAESCCCQPEVCTVKCPVECYQKVSVGVIREKPAKKTVEKKRIVEKKEPYTVTCYKPVVTYQEVPVKVCCPVPCCKKCRQAEPETTTCGCD